MSKIDKAILVWGFGFMAILGFMIFDLLVLESGFSLVFLCAWICGGGIAGMVLTFLSR